MGDGYKIIGDGYKTFPHFVVWGETSLVHHGTNHNWVQTHPQNLPSYTTQDQPVKTDIKVKIYLPCL